MKNFDGVSFFGGVGVLFERVLLNFAEPNWGFYSRGGGDNRGGI